MYPHHTHHHNLTHTYFLSFSLSPPLPFMFISGVLVRSDHDERKQHFQSLLTGLEHFSKELSKTDGPLFLPHAQLSTVDLALLPWAFRYYVLEHYRGPEFTIPYTTELEAYHVWYNHVINLESVKRTLPDKQEYLEHMPMEVPEAKLPMPFDEVWRRMNWMMKRMNITQQHQVIKSRG